MLATVIHFLIWILVLGLLYFLVIWVLGLLGIAVPDRVMKIIGAILLLIILLWFVQVVTSGGPVPRLLTVLPFT